MKKKSIDFAKFSSIKVGGVSDVYILDDLEVLDDISLDDFVIIGSCNNILLGDNHPKLLKLSKRYDYITLLDDCIKIGGATPSGKIASFCKKHNIANFEFVSHLPGTLGGLVFMNAGLKEYEIFNNLLSVKTTNGIMKRDSIEFGYRYTNIDSPILEVTFELNYGFDKKKVELFKKMRANQPSTPSAGSCFKNPLDDYAGRLIEEVGLKGKRVGAMEFSQQHANFLVNHGGGTFKEATHLIKEAQKRVLEEFGISLECEILVLE